MPKLSLSPAYLKDSFTVLKRQGLKGLILGKTAPLSPGEQALVDKLQTSPDTFRDLRQGQFRKIDAIHKGRGTVYLLGDPTDNKKSLVVFASDCKIANGPDLWLYVSDSAKPRKDYGEYINLGLLKGNKGAQVFTIDKPITKLKDRKSIIIYCKQFEVLFSYALLA